MTSLVFDKIKQKVSFLSKQLNFDKYKKTTGRKLAIPLENILTLALYKQKQNIATKKAIFNDFKNQLKCSYKTLVVNLNRWYFLALIIFVLMLKINCSNAHLIKHIDSTDLPVCLFKNAHAHQVMKGLAQYGKSSKGLFYGLKMHIISDLKRKILAVKFTGGAVDERKVVIKMADDMTGIFIADAGYVSEKLSREFYQENKRILLVKPRSNMKKIMTEIEEKLYQTRMLIEINFRILKMFYGLETSLPHSRDGYFANYVYALLAYQIV